MKNSIQDLMLRFYSDEPDVMRSLKKRLKEDVNPTLLDMRECNLHKGHNVFAKGIEAFCNTVESTLLDVYQFYKNSAVQSAALKTTRKCLGLPENLLLHHVNYQWLTLNQALMQLTH